MVRLENGDVKRETRRDGVRVFEFVSICPENILKRR